MAEESWFHLLQLAIQEIKSIAPANSNIILVDDASWGIGDNLEGRRITPFLEEDGLYMGPPKNDTKAILELEQKQKKGSEYIVFAWGSFWWLHHYEKLHKFLRSHFNCLLENDRVIIFNLKEIKDEDSYKNDILNEEHLHYLESKNELALPDTVTLSRHLSALLSNDKNSQDHVIVLSRKPGIFTSTFPTEIITCKFNEEQPIHLFCKYVAHTDGEDFGHRGGVEYEIRIYDEVLRNVPIPSVKFYGKCYFPETNVTMMVLEYLNDSLRIFKINKPKLLLNEAASLIGRLHNFFELKTPSFIKNYDEAHYRVWIEKFESIAYKFKSKHPWVINLFTYYLENINILITNPRTLIHGEYYPHNIIVQNHIIYIIDWESAAVGPGEIDLASLLDGWEEPEIGNAIEAYQIARWGEMKNVPENFDHILLLSQIYYQFCWIREIIEDWRSEYLLKLAKKAGCY